MEGKIKIFDSRPHKHALRQEILNGLMKPIKELPCKLFYDKRGSLLFDQICELQEYYLTSAEISIIREHITGIASLIIGPKCLLVEFGSGSSKKTKILLDHIPQLAAYMPIDICWENLIRSAMDILSIYPDLELLPVCADYNNHFELPAINTSISQNLIYVPGSNIGNFHPHEAVKFMHRIGAVWQPECALLIGLDLKKDAQKLHRAYNDHTGISAEFNLNMLVRLNHEFGTDFQIDQFRHHAFYNEDMGRIEVHLVAVKHQVVRMDGTEILFQEGESIWTESSYKYTVAEFEQLAAEAGFQVKEVWMDDANQFSVQYLVLNTNHGFPD